MAHDIFFYQILETDISGFSLDQNLTPEIVNEVVVGSIETLNPSLETIKMQVNYDES